MLAAQQLPTQCSSTVRQPETAHRLLSAPLSNPRAPAALLNCKDVASRQQLCVLSSSSRLQGSSQAVSMQPDQVQQQQRPSQHAPAPPPEAAANSAAAAAAAAAENGSGAPRGKRSKRTDSYAWCCPACGNKFAAAARLIDHMAGCCADLLPSKQQQQQQHSAPAAAADAAGADLAAGSGVSCSDEGMQQQLAAAAEREQALRMRVLRLMHVADPGGGVAPVLRGNAAGGEAVDADADDESDCSDDEDAVAATAETAVGSGGGSAACSEAAAPGAAGSGGKTYKRRRRQARPPLRGLQQLMDILQLPRNRWGQHCVQRCGYTALSSAPARPAATAHMAA